MGIGEFGNPFANSPHGLSLDQSLGGASATFSLIGTYAIQIWQSDSAATRRKRDEGIRPISVLHEPRITAPFAPSLSHQINRGRPGALTAARHTLKRLPRARIQRCRPCDVGPSSMVGSGYDKPPLGTRSHQT